MPEIENTKPINVIPAINPTPEEMRAICEKIKVNHNFKVDVKPVSFRFKTVQDKETGLETRRETVDLALPFPSVEGIVAILEAGGTQLELLTDVIENVIISVARDIIADNPSINASNFPIDKVSWEAIANMPKAQRRGGGIPKETWEEFAKDYIAVMPGVTGKTVEQVTNAAKILLNKLQQVRTNGPVLELLVQQLAIYAENSQNVAEFQDCIAFLLNKADVYLNTSPEELLANL